MAGKWLLRIVTLAVWALAVLSATWWSLQFLGTGATSASAKVATAPAPGSDPADLAKVFGPPLASAPMAVASASVAVDPGKRFALLGVVANRAKSGVALISVDGKAARPYRVGSQVEESYVLKSVATRSAVLEPATRPGAALTLELAVVPSASTGGLPQSQSVVPATPALPSLPLPSASTDAVANPNQLLIPRPGLPSALPLGRPTGERGTL